MNGFKFDFSKIFWGGAHRAPSPDPSPRFFSGFALGSGFALNSRALHAIGSGFVLNLPRRNFDLVAPLKLAYGICNLKLFRWRYPKLQSG